MSTIAEIDVEAEFEDPAEKKPWPQVLAKLIRRQPLGAAGAAFRGHEFHFASVQREAAPEPLFTCRDARGADLGPAGCRLGPVMGSFVHLVDVA